MRVTEEVSQLFRGRLKESAPLNMLDMEVTEEVSQLFRGWLKEAAL